MTADRPAQDLREPVPGRTERAELGLPAPTILSMCDRLLGEVGRRHHMFAWLRAPGAGAGEWLAVDAYYPRARLVVMCGRNPRRTTRSTASSSRRVGSACSTLDPPVLGNDRDAVKATLAAKIFDLEHMPRVRPSRTPKAAQPAPLPAAPPTPERAPPPASGPALREWTPVKVAHTSVPRGWVQGLGVIAGLAFAVVLIVEVYLGVIKVAIGAGRLGAGLAIVIDAFSRALGTAASERDGRRGLRVRVRGRRVPGRGPGARSCGAPVASRSSPPRWPGCSRSRPVRSPYWRCSSEAERGRYPGRSGSWSPGELVFSDGHPSWRSMLGVDPRGLLFAIVAGVIAGIVTRIANGGVQAGWVTTAVLVIFIIVLVWGLVRRISTTYTITNRRLTIRTGLLSREMHETRLERVQNVNSRQRVLERVLGVGSVDFDTAGSAEFDFSFRGVDDPAQIVRTVDKALDDLRLTHPQV